MKTTLGNLMLWLATGMIILSLTPSMALSQNIDLNDQTACEIGQTVTFTASINNAPTEVDAFAFDISFDNTILSFDETDADDDTLPESITKGSLVQNWNFFGGSEPDGNVRIAGATVEDIIAPGTSGELLQIEFQVLQLTPMTLTLTNLQDDFSQEGWAPGTGELLIDCTCNYDIDGNSVSDALTDGLLILRFLFGFRGDTLIDGAVAPDCTRCTAEDIEAFLNPKTCP